MSGARPVAREALSRERIASVALALADRDGFERVTMRRLATDLGVGTMTLYGYFRDKEELIDAAVDVAADEQRVVVGEGPWKEQLRELMRGLKETLGAHPSALRLRFTRPMLSPGALRTTEAGMQILGRAGFDTEEAARAYRALFLYTFGFASFSVPDDPEDVRRQTRVALTALSPNEYPALSAAVEEAAEAMAGDDPFEFGLARLLDGVEALLKKSRREAPRHPRAHR